MSTFPQPQFQAILYYLQKSTQFVRLVKFRIIKIFRLSGAKLEAVKFNSLVQAGIIRLNQKDWSSPLVMVRKRKMYGDSV